MSHYCRRTICTMNCIYATDWNVNWDVFARQKVFTQKRAHNRSPFRRFMGIYLRHPLVCTRFTIHAGPLFKSFSQALASCWFCSSSLPMRCRIYIMFSWWLHKANQRANTVSIIFSKLRHIIGGIRKETCEMNIRVCTKQRF